MRTVTHAALVLVLSAAAVIAGFSKPALAHTDVASTDPADGKALSESPQSVSVTFTKPVTADTESVKVVDADGNRVDTGDAATLPEDASTVAVTIAEDVPTGAYGVQWRVVASDSHPRTGSFAFTTEIAVPAAGARAAEQTASDTSTGAADLDAQRAAIDEALGDGDPASIWTGSARVASWVTYVGSLLAIGGAIFLSFVYDGRRADRGVLSKVVMWAAIVGAGATVVEALFQIGAVGNAASALAGPFGAGVVVRLLGSALLFAAARGGWSPRGRFVGIAGAFVVATSFLFVGHEAETGALTLTSHFIHAVAVAAWFGGIVLLAITISRRRRRGESAAGSAAIVDHFSSVALGAVVLASVVGVALSWMHLNSPAEIFSTGYGLLLLAKVVLVGGVVAIGAFNHRVLVPAIVAEGDNASWRRLGRTARTEAVALVGVLGVTAIFVTTGAPAAG